MKNVLIINGSASAGSSNRRLIDYIQRQTAGAFKSLVFEDLKLLPHFEPELSVSGTPEAILAFRQMVEQADGVIICTPEYVFSIPSGLKNVLEWCVATTVFHEKPLAIITASASGVKGHEELQLIMKTLTARFHPDTLLLIQGIKGKIDNEGNILELATQREILTLIEAFQQMIADR